MTHVSEKDRIRDREGRDAIKRLSKPIRVRTLVAQLFVTLSALLQFVPYLALVKLGDVLLTAYQNGQPPNATSIASIVRFLLFGFSMRLFFYFLSLVITHFADMKLRFIIRRNIVDRLSHVPLAWFGTHDSGYIRNAVQDDTKTVHTVIAHAPVDLLNGILSPLVLFIFLLVINWRLALIGIATVPLYFLLYGFSMKDMGPKTAEMNGHLTLVSSTMVELIAGIKVVKAFGKTGEAHRNYREATNAFSESYWNWCAPLIGLCSIAGEFVAVPLLILVNLGGGALLMMSGHAELAEILAATLIAIVLPTAMMTVANIVWSYQMAGSAAIRLSRLLEAPVLEEPTAPRVPQGHDVAIENVSYSYGETEALRGINLHLKPGTVTALIGPSGSGKSTLATLIARFDDPDTGSIRIGGVDLRQMARRDLYENVSFILQDAMLLNTEIRRNIALAKPDSSLDDIRRAAKIAQIDDVIMRLPKGYDSLLGTDCSLSGGEEQRLAIARAVLADTPILIMDEATAFADPDTEVEVQHALTQLIRERTVLVIAHRLNSVLGADQIAIMENGRITALGDHESLLTNDHYQSLLRQSGLSDRFIRKGNGQHA